MSKIGWPELEALYRSRSDDVRGKTWVTADNESILNTLKLLAHDEDCQEETGIKVLSDIEMWSEINLGQPIEVEIVAPILKLGRYVETFDGLLKGPKARIQEPEHYFIIKGSITARQDPPSDLQIRYRKIILLIGMLRKICTIDEVRQELLFFRDSRLRVPLNFNEQDLNNLVCDTVSRFLAVFADPLHEEQKLTILTSAIIDLISDEVPNNRFRRLLYNLDFLLEEVCKGYRLFTSNFTYSKIKREVEAAQADFITRIHKTFTDLQGQVLGIPVATIVVVTQLKAPTPQGHEWWTNVATLCGAWIFLIFLLAAIQNQWVTLEAISFEFSQQRSRLEHDFEGVKEDFVPAFKELEKRARCLKIFYTLVAIIGLLGAIFSTYVACKFIIT